MLGFHLFVLLFPVFHLILQSLNLAFVVTGFDIGLAKSRQATVSLSIRNPKQGKVPNTSTKVGKETVLLVRLSQILVCLLGLVL